MPRASLPTPNVFETMLPMATVHVALCGFLVILSSLSGALLFGIWPGHFAHLQLNLWLLGVLALAYFVWSGVVVGGYARPETGVGFYVAAYGLSIRALAEITVGMVGGWPHPTISPEHRFGDGLYCVRTGGLAAIAFGLTLSAVATYRGRRRKP